MWAPKCALSLFFGIQVALGQVRARVMFVDTSQAVYICPTKHGYCFILCRNDDVGSHQHLLCTSTVDQIVYWETSGVKTMHEEADLNRSSQVPLPCVSFRDYTAFYEELFNVIYRTLHT